MSCIYEGYWIYGFGVLFCSMRPLLRTFPPYYSNVCVNFGDHQAQQLPTILHIDIQNIRPNSVNVLESISNANY